MMLESLRDALVKLPATGSDGFEGLIKTALTAWTGRRFFLASSGSQSGRDGRSAAGALEIVFEAKRYDKAKLESRALIGEFGEAIQSRPDLDLYVLAATCPIGDKQEAAFSEVLNNHGVDLLLLDWGEEDLYPLPVFLARVQDEILAWFRPQVDNATFEQLTGDLASIGAHPRFSEVTDWIHKTLSSESLGEDSLRFKLRHRLLKIFSDRALARRTLGQFLCPNYDSSRTCARIAPQMEIVKWWAESDQFKYLAILGQEGVGKSWTLPQWWISLRDDEAPILIIIPSWRLRGSEIIDGLTLIAEAISHLLAETACPIDVRGWKKRLARWSERERSSSNWILLLDGLNETPRTRWADMIEMIQPIAGGLGLKLAVSSRTEFWMQEVCHRTFTYSASILQIGDYDDFELNDVLTRRGINPDDISPQLRKVICNPRMLDIADALLGQSTTREITRDRLLFEYWKARLKERGNLIAHTNADIDALLARHAEVLKDQEGKFLIDGWLEFSGRSKRMPGPEVTDDLTEIVDGPFFQASGDYYLPRLHVVPYIMGLLLCRQLREDQSKEPGALLDDFIDPIHGLDEASEIIASAVAISLLSNYPSEIATLLLERWLGLQNVGDSDFSNFSAYTPEYLSLYLDLLERLYKHPTSARREWIVLSLRDHRDHPRVSEKLIAKLNHWMGFWSFENKDESHGVRDAGFLQSIREHSEKRKVKITSGIQSLTEGENQLFRNLCTEVEAPHLPQIASVVEIIAAGWKLAPLADGILAWSLALEIGRRHLHRSNIDWLFEANFADFTQTRMALRKVAEDAKSLGSSRIFINAVARAFCFAGLPEDVIECDRLFVVDPELLEFLKGWRYVEGYCDSDPLDPFSQLPLNLDRAVASTKEIQASSLFVHMGTTTEQHHLDELTPALARFAPETLWDLWGKLLHTLPERNDQALRQLCFHIEAASPLLAPDDISNLRVVFDKLCHGSNPADSGLQRIWPSLPLAAILPHVSGSDQLSMILSVPNPARDLDVRSIQQLKPSDPNHFEELLAAAITTKQDSIIALLYFAASGTQVFTDTCSELICSCMLHQDEVVRSMAFEVAWISQHKGMLNFIASRKWDFQTPEGSEIESYYGSRALAQTFDEKTPVELLRGISPSAWSTIPKMTCTHALFPKCIEILDDILTELIQTKESVVLPPSLRERPERPGSKFPVYSRNDSQYEDEKAPDEKMKEFSSALDEDSYAANYATYSQKLRTDIGRIKQLALHSALEVPSLQLFRDARGDAASRLIEIGRKVLIAEGRNAPLLANWALALVVPIACLDEEMAQALYIKYSEVRPLVQIYDSNSQLPFLVSVLMETGPGVLLNAKRNAFYKAPNDELISQLVFAAESNRQGGWIREFADDCIHQGHPLRTSLGYTILGFCDDTAVSQKLLDCCVTKWDLGTTIKNARFNSERNCWARHWYQAASNARTPKEMWAFSQLLIKSADRRRLLWFGKEFVSPFNSPWTTFEHCFRQEFKWAQEKWSKKRSEKLYGRDQPSHDFFQLLNLTGT